MFNSGRFQVLLLQSRIFSVISLKMVRVFLVNTSCCNKEASEILGFPGGLGGKESACNVGDLCLIPGWEDPLEKGKATHSSILAWRTPWTTVHGVTKSWI